MPNYNKNGNGFTLIELVIVVAIIGILAAIAIPQLTNNLQKGYNAAALTDVKNTKASEESLFSDAQSYGRSGVGLTPVVAGPPGVGAPIPGPLGPPSSVSSGAFIAGQDIQTHGWSVGIGVSNNVVLVANSAGVTIGATYTLTAKHRLGNRQFVTEAESPAIMFCENSSFVGNAVALPAAGIATTANSIDISPAVACKGSAASPNWNNL